jgi:hypothetical protein
MQTTPYADSPEVVIEGGSLTKRYGEFVAVDGIDFEVVRGECFGSGFESGGTPGPAKGEICNR